MFFTPRTCYTYRENSTTNCGLLSYHSVFVGLLEEPMLLEADRDILCGDPPLRNDLRELFEAFGHDKDEYEAPFSLW